MRTCPKCGLETEYIDSVHHRCYTVKEWKKFDVWTGDRIDGHEMTMQEILLNMYNITLIDHRTKKFAKVRYPGERFYHLERIPPLVQKSKKETAVAIAKGFNLKNFDKGMAIFDKGMEDFGKSMDQMTKELGGDKKQQKKNLDMIWGKKKTKSTRKQNMDIIWGKKKTKKSPKVKIWNDKKPRKKRKTKSDEWDKHEKNLEKLWGKRR